MPWIALSAIEWLSVCETRLVATPRWRAIEIYRRGNTTRIGFISAQESAAIIAVCSLPSIEQDRIVDMADMRFSRWPVAYFQLFDTDWQLSTLSPTSDAPTRRKLPAQHARAHARSLIQHDPRWTIHYPRTGYMLRPAR